VHPERDRQQLLFVWTESSNLSSRIVGWTFHNGNDPDAEVAELPHARGVDVLADGWRLIQSSLGNERPAADGRTADGREHEWLFERIVPVADRHHR
jgi:hypothetical protein